MANKRKFVVHWSLASIQKGLKFNRQPFTHDFNWFFGSALIASGNVDFHFVLYLETVFEKKKILPWCLVPMH